MRLTSFAPGLARKLASVLEALLLRGGRQRVAGAPKLIGVRNKLAETVQQIDALIGEEGSPEAAGSWRGKYWRSLGSIPKPGFELSADH